MLRALLLALVLLVPGQSPDCAYCSPAPCVSACGGSCYCIRSPGRVSGSCYGAEAVPSLIAEGFEVMP